MSSQHQTDEAIRETYREIELGEGCVGRIADPHNANAWIQSDVTQPVLD